MEPDQLKKSLQSIINPAHSGEVGATESKNPQEVFAWTAPIRAYKKKSKGILRFYLALALLLSLLVAFFKEFILIIPIWAVLFLVYMLTITPPHNTKHIITKYGLNTGNKPYSWDDIGAFYFLKKFDYDVLVLLPQSPFGLPLYLVIDSAQTHSRLMNVLSEHIIYLEHPEKSMSDRLAEWLTSLMPEEIEEAQAEPSKHVEKPL